MSALLVAQLANGLGVGATYALVGLGFGLLFSVRRVLNLAYGDVVMVSAMMAAVTALRFTEPGGRLVFVAVAIATAVVAGLAVHFLVIRPLGDVSDVRSARHSTALVATIGVGIVLQNVTMITVGAYPVVFPRLFPSTTFRLGEVDVPTAPFFVATLVVVCVLCIRLMLSTSAFGLRLRATADNRELAVTAGIDVNRTEVVGVAISAAMAGIAGLGLCGMTGVASASMGSIVGFKALIVVIAASEDPRGIMVAAFCLGLAESLAVAFLDSGFRDAVAYVALLTYLLVSTGDTGARRLV